MAHFLPFEGNTGQVSLYSHFLNSQQFMAHSFLKIGCEKYLHATFCIHTSDSVRLRLKHECLQECRFLPCRYNPGMYSCNDSIKQYILNSTETYRGRPLGSGVFVRALSRLRGNDIRKNCQLAKQWFWQVRSRQEDGIATSWVYQENTPQEDIACDIKPVQGKKPFQEIAHAATQT